MTNVSTTPAPARTDGDARDARVDQPSDGTVRRLALGLSAGAVAWSVATFAYGFTPGTEAGVKVTDLASLAFQLGVWSLLSLQVATRATGTSRKARVMLKVERVLLALAMVWTVVHALVPSARDSWWLAVLDAFWPLSMLGMFVIGIKVALAGRWRGIARVWPLVAESWAVVSVPSMGIFGATVGQYVGATHLLVGYTVLGLLVAARPDLVRPRP